MTNRTFLGTDVSKDTLDFFLLDQNNPDKGTSVKLSNSRKGYSELLTFLARHKVELDSLLVIMEHTGVYTLEFMCFLDEQGIEFSIFPGLEIKRSLGITRGKNDKVDAIRIAQYGFMIRHKIKPTELPSVDIMKLKQLITTRALFVRQRAACKSTTRTQKKFNQYTQLQIVEDLLKEQINSLTARIQEIEKAMEDVIEQSPEIKKNFELLCSITGIGKMIAYALIAYTNNFNAFPSARHFMSYVGVAPFESESGQYKGKKKVCSLANKRMKALLHSGVSSMKTHDPESKEFYERKLAAGKHKRQVANALAGKLVQRAFAVIKRGTPFVQLYSQKIIQKNVA